MESLIYFKIAVLALLCIIPFIKEKGLKLYNPAVLLSIIYFFEFGLPNIAMLNDTLGIYDFYSFFSVKALDQGLNFVILVFIMFLIGYYLPYFNNDAKKLIIFILNKLPKINSYELKIRNLPLVLIILFALGWISRIILYKTGMYYHTEIGSKPIFVSKEIIVVAQIIKNLSLFPIVGLSLCFYEWIKDKTKKKFLFLSLLLLFIETAYALPSGSKERILFPIAILVFLYSLRSKIPLVPILISTTFIVLFLFPFVGIYRSLMSSTGNMVLNLSRTLDLYLDMFQKFNLQTLNMLFSTIVGERLNYALVVSNIVENTPRIWDFKLGESYFQFFIAIIPRILWPSKPYVTSYAQEFGREYGFTSPVDYSTSVDITWVGEMFLNFGWFGILVGFFYGFLYRIIYSYFLSSKHLTQLSVILYVLSLYIMVRGSAFTIQFAGLSKIYIVVLLIFLPFIKKVRA